MNINASNSKVVQAHIPVLIEDEPMEEVDIFKYLDSRLIVNSKGTEEIRCRINHVRSAFSLSMATVRYQQGVLACSFGCLPINRLKRVLILSGYPGTFHMNKTCLSVTLNMLQRNIDGA